MFRTEKTDKVWSQPHSCHIKWLISKMIHFYHCKWHMNINVHIQRYTLKGGYEQHSPAPVQDDHNVHSEGLRLCSKLTDPHIHYIEIHYNFWYSLNVAVGGSVKSQRDNTITRGVSQSNIPSPAPSLHEAGQAFSISHMRHRVDIWS